MSPFDWTIVAAAICGLCMVVGGIVLLYKGAIKLEEVKSSGAFALEFQQFGYYYFVNVPLRADPYYIEVYWGNQLLFRNVVTVNGPRISLPPIALP